MTIILEWLSQQVIWIALICLVGAFGYIFTAVRPNANGIVPSSRWNGTSTTSR